jgi:hypothetical protein
LGRRSAPGPMPIYTHLSSCETGNFVAPGLFQQVNQGCRFQILVEGLLVGGWSLGRLLDGTARTSSL